MDYRIKRQIGAWVGGAILALVIVLAACDAHAADIRPRGAPAQLLAQFDTVSDACLSAPLTSAGKYSPKCVERDRIARALERAGYERSRHDVWFRSRDVPNLYTLVRSAIDVSSTLWRAPAVLRELARASRMDDVELLAIWQQHAPEFRDADPTAWAVASELMGQISAAHPNDPRFMLD